MSEGRIVETTKQFNRSLGIQWGFDGVADNAHGNSTGLVFPNNAAGSGAVNLLTGGSNGLLRLSLGNILDTFTLDATLQAAENEGLVNILSAPKIATLNNVGGAARAACSPGQTLPTTPSPCSSQRTLRLDVTRTSPPTARADESRCRSASRMALPSSSHQRPVATKEARTRVIVPRERHPPHRRIYKVTSDQGQDASRPRRSLFSAPVPQPPRQATQRGALSSSSACYQAIKAGK